VSISKSFFNTCNLIYEFSNKLEGLSLASLPRKVADKAGAYPNEAPLRCSTVRKLLALPTKNRPGWKGLTGTNTLTYYKNLYGSNKFNNIGHGAILIKLFTYIS
jgi:hypothetical protein